MTDHIYLAHHGIKGMKWGVRRFRNEDGTLTSAGKKRYSDDGGKQKRTLTDKQKKALVIAGASAVAIGLAAYGVHRYRSVLNDRTMKALAVEGKAIADDQSNWYYSFGNRIPNQSLITTKQQALNNRVRAYERSKSPAKQVADIVTKQDYLKEHKLARDLSRGRQSIYDNSRNFGTDYQFMLYNIGENPGHNPNFAPYEFDPTITVQDVIRGVKRRK